ncbi:hypothetical protein BGX28_009729 [Mortierella sp. GBA30]|nr:hypothetical protein BGX28_009729 [Mortierella sp. GBA30]
MMIYNSLKLYTSTDTFTLVPVHSDASAASESIVIQRGSGEVRLNAPAIKVPSDEEVMNIFGVIGFLRLLAGEYMVVITERTKIGRIGEHDVFKVKDYKILPLSRNNLALTEAQIGEEASYLSLLHAHLQSGQFHFSYGYELTHTLQRQSGLNDNTQPIWERADERFFWNRRLHSKFIDHSIKHKDQDLSKFILPIVNGFAEIKTAEINKKPFTFALFSRRSRHRAGTRYFSRGVDAQGNVSNFNETEQIVVADAGLDGSASSLPGGQIFMSHVQTRGSIPIYWTQINNIKYTPKLQIFENPETENSFRKHFETQKTFYGPQLVINLINKTGYEGPMGVAFQKHIELLSDSDVKYHHFDFHHECSKMKWHRVALLLDHFHEELVAQGYFKAVVSKDGLEKMSQRQTSIVRTNCMDCLDRTNVVQSVVSRWVLNRQLREIGILGNDEKFENFDDFEFLFRNVWADNADVVSCAYSGTGALKTDFTRTGNRTKAGALQDLQNSIVRYIKNNFLDGHRQDAYDLFLQYEVDATGAYPLVDTRPLQIKALPAVLLVGVAMIFAAAIVPEDSLSTLVILFASFWLAIISYVFKYIVANGVHYVNWPRLVPLPHGLSPYANAHLHSIDFTLDHNPFKESHLMQQPQEEIINPVPVSASQTAGSVASATPAKNKEATSTAVPQQDAQTYGHRSHDQVQLTDEQILTQMQAIKDEEANAHPLVDISEDLSELEKEYENGSSAFRNKIRNLADTHDRMRRSRGDAFAFAWFERVMLAKSKPELHEQAVKAIEETKDLLLAAQFEPLAFEDFYQVTLETLQNLVHFTPEELLSMFQNDEISNSIVMHFRLVASAYLKTHQDDYAPFLEFGQTMDEYCSMHVEAMGRESEEMMLIALTKATHVSIEVAYLSGNENTDEVNFLPFLPDTPPYMPPLVLLYRPGHYDILYRKSHCLEGVV